jgi:hypothetical protein
MRAARVLVIFAVAALVIGACGSGGLTDDERTWCLENEDDVLNQFGTLFADDPIMDSITEEGFLNAVAEGATSLGEYLSEAYPSQWEQSCQSALADR